MLLGRDRALKHGFGELVVICIVTHQDFNFAALVIVLDVPAYASNGTTLLFQTSCRRRLQSTPEQTTVDHHHVVLLVFMKEILIFICRLIDMHRNLRVLFHLLSILQCALFELIIP